MAKRQAERDAGKKPDGKDPELPTSVRQKNDQRNLSDEQSRIMTTGASFDQCYNAQAAVDTDTMIIVASFVPQAGNEVSKSSQCWKRWSGNWPGSPPSHFLAATGYFSAANVDPCEQAGITPLFAIKRSQHHEPVLEHFTEPPALDDDADAVATMAHRLKMRSGRADYCLHDQTVEYCSASSNIR